MYCKHCEAEFEPNRGNQKFCSVNCRRRFWANDYYQKHKWSVLLKQSSEQNKARANELAKQPERRAQRAKYLRDKRKSDPLFKLKENVYGRIRATMPQVKKKDLSLVLGYTINNLWQYLLSNCEHTEQDFLDGKLELDHVIPYHWFIVLELGDTEFRKLWNFRNLRLIPVEENRQRKHKQWDWQEIECRNITDLLPCGADVIYKQLQTN